MEEDKNRVMPAAGASVAEARQVRKWEKAAAKQAAREKAQRKHQAPASNTKSPNQVDDLSDAVSQLFLHGERTIGRLDRHTALRCAQYSTEFTPTMMLSTAQSTPLALPCKPVAAAKGKRKVR